MRGTLERAHTSSFAPRAAEIERAALRALAYADLFEYALDLDTLHRYLHGITASRSETARALAVAASARGGIGRQHGYYTLAGREELVDVRQQRSECAEYLWPKAILWGRRIARLPFVRMVAITGALAWDNVKPGDDIDYLIVARPGRVWVARALVAILSRVAHLDGVHLCANYVLSSSALELTDRNVYTAYELVQMIPVAGRALYRRMRRLNQWTNQYLPNAGGEPAVGVERDRAPARRRDGLAHRVVRKGIRLLERNLDNQMGNALEHWEMARSVRRRAGQAVAPDEVMYSFDLYKGHTSGHQQAALAAFAARLAALGLEDS